MRSGAAFIATGVTFLLMATSHVGETLIPVPESDVILTISGEIDITNVDDTLQFDHAALSSLESRIIETSTLWTEGTHTFQGVSLSTLTELLGVEDGELIATAINDYAVEIPVAEATEDGPMIAYLMDGEEMSVRDKGPLWVIYPFDSSPDYRTAVIYSRSIWQLDSIEVVK